MVGDRPFFRRLYATICVFFLCLSCGVLSGCQGGQAPREFAPDGTIVQQAMQRELQQYYRDLSQTIAAKPPSLKFNQIQVKQLDSFFLKRLPVYHVQGTYDLELTFPNHTDKRKRNHFELYLQRQTEGKTWRSLKKIPSGWQSYALND